ncbi:MAG: hypothetical protein GC156_03805 [Actinomycetales bacterium]|nr:hypothetical protein [Actinomycetales bacterium]
MTAERSPSWWPIIAWAAMPVESRPADLRDRIAAVLASLDPDTTPLVCWRGLTMLQAELREDSPWHARVQGLRRRNHYATELAVRRGSEVSALLSSGGIDHAVTGELTLAVTYEADAGTVPVSAVRIWVDPAKSRDDLVDALATAIPRAAWRDEGIAVAASSEATTVRLVRGWTHWESGSLRRALVPGRAEVSREGGSLVVMRADWEAARILASRGAPGTDGWLLDLSLVASAHPSVWEQVPARARDLVRSQSIADSWRAAHRAGVAPSVPPMVQDPLIERAKQTGHRLRHRRGGSAPDPA